MTCLREADFFSPAVTMMAGRSKKKSSSPVIDRDGHGWLRGQESFTGSTTKYQPSEELTRQRKGEEGGDRRRTC